MLKRGRICEKFQKRKLECKVVAQLVADKILRITELTCEVTEGKLSLLLKHNVMHVNKHNCEQLLFTSNYLAILAINILKTENYFQTHAAGFVHSPYLVETGEKVLQRFTSYCSIETR